MKGVLIETDLIVEFLTAGREERPLLRLLLQTLPCYTTFLQAAEIYSAVRDDEERRLVERALFGLKILGASGRYAKTIGRALTSVVAIGGHRTAIVAAMAVESQLPVITDSYLSALAEIPGPTLIAAATLRDAPDAAALLALLAPAL